MLDIIDSVEKALGDYHVKENYSSWGDRIDYINLPGYRSEREFPFRCKLGFGKVGFTSVFPVAVYGEASKQTEFNEKDWLLRLFNNLEDHISIDVWHKPKITYPSISSEDYKRYTPAKVFLIQEAGQIEETKKNAVDLEVYPEWVLKKVEELSAGKYKSEPEPHKDTIYSVACVILYPNKEFMNEGLTQTNFTVRLNEIGEKSRKLIEG
jgi:hypothetical protein